MAIQTKTEIIIAAVDKSTSVINAIGNRLQWLTSPTNSLASATKNLALVTAAGATALVGIGTATFLFGKHTADAADEVGDLAAKYGTTTQAVQLFGAAVKEGGGDMEGAAKGLGKLTRNITEAIYQGGEMRSVFAGAGVTLDDLKKKTPTQILEKMAIAFSHSNDEGKKGLILTKALGKEGLIFNDTLSKGPEKIRQRFKEMTEDGRFLSDEQVDAADANDKAYQRLMGTIEGLKVTLGSELWPAMTKITEEAQRWIVVNKDLLKDDFKEFVKNLPGLVKGGVKALTALAQILGVVVKVFREIYHVIGPVATVLLALAIPLAPTILAFGQLVVVVTQAILWMSRASGIVTFLTMTFKALWVIVQVHPFFAIGAAVVYLAVLVYRNWDNIVAYVSKAWERIKAMFDVNFFDGVIQLWVEAWQGLGNTILGVIKSILPDAILPDAIKKFEFTYGVNRANNITAAQAAGQSTKVGGVLKIQIDSNSPAKVTELRKDNPAFDFDVNSGLIMSGS